jgi:hypothetical protein
MRKTIVSIATLFVIALMLPLPGYSKQVSPGASSPVITPRQAATGDLATPKRSGSGGEDGEKQEGDPAERAAYFYRRRVVGDASFNIGIAAELRARAAAAVLARGGQPRGAAPQAFGGNWSPIGPDPILQVGRTSGIFVAAFRARQP